MEADMDVLGCGSWWLDGVRLTICWALRTGGVGLYMRWCDLFFNTGAAAAVKHSVGIKTTLFLLTFPSQLKLIRADVLSQNSTSTSAPRSARRSRLPAFTIPPGAPRHVSEESPEVALRLAPLLSILWWKLCQTALEWRRRFQNITCAGLWLYVTLKHDRSTKVRPISKNRVN